MLLEGELRKELNQSDESKGTVLLFHFLNADCNLLPAPWLKSQETMS